MRFSVTIENEYSLQAKDPKGVRICLPELDSHFIEPGGIWPSQEEMIRHFLNKAIQRRISMRLWVPTDCDQRKDVNSITVAIPWENELVIHISNWFVENRPELLLSQIEHDEDEINQGLNLDTVPVLRVDRTPSIYGVGKLLLIAARYCIPIKIENAQVSLIEKTEKYDT